MVIAVLAARQFPVEAGVGRHVNLAADDRVDPRLLRRLIEVNDTVHDTVIRDRRAVHPQLLHIPHILFYFVGTVQKTKLRVDM